MSDLMRKKECRHGLIDPDLDVHQEHPEWAACMGFGLVPVEPVEVGYWCDYEGRYFTDPQEHMTEATWRKRDGGPLGHYGYECEGRKLTRRVMIVEADDE